MSQTQAAVPAHIPPPLIVDFDFAHVPGAEEDVYRAWSGLQAGPPLVWTSHYGGHWIATRAALIEELQKDYIHFSHEVFTLPRRGNSRPRVAPLEYDPPEHTDFRRILNPGLSPAVIKVIEPEIRELAARLIEGFQPRGHCEFVSEFGHFLPNTVFLRLLDLPQTERERFLAWGEIIVRSVDEHAKHRAFSEVGAYLQKAINERREQPRDDLISRVLQGTVQGRALTAKETLGMCLLLFAGGLDTVASMMGFIALALARSPQLRRQLAEKPERIPQAIEEFLRRHGLSNTTRLVTQDYEFHGVQLKKGDVVMVPISLHGLGPLRWTRPWEIDFERDTRGHASFGNGPHRCVGATLARTELRVFLEEWFKRIPDFEITAGVAPRTLTGAVNAVTYLPLSWPAAAHS